MGKSAKVYEYFVYELINPLNNKTFYIGYTHQPDVRFNQHLKLRTITSARYIKLLLENGIKPEFRIVYQCKNKNQASGVESFLIREYKLNGHFLMNHLTWRKKDFLKNTLTLRRNIKLVA